jgi:hypothetical protein
MSEFVDTTLSRYLDQQPGMRDALLTDPVQHMQVEVLRQTLNMVERALIDEGVPEETRRRVLNRAVWGEPEARVDVHARMRDSEKLRRERDWLLADIDPSPLIEERRRQRETEAQWDANREAEERTLDRMASQPDQLTTEQVRGMWHDVMPVPDGPLRTETETFGDDGTGPVSGEETSG